MALLLTACTSQPSGPPSVPASPPEITQARVEWTDDMGRVIGWTDASSMLRPGMVELRQSYLCGDECNQQTTLRFVRERGERLPRYHSGSIRVDEQFADGPETFSLVADRVEIQEWGETYSGRLILAEGTTSYAPDTLTFWAQAD